MTKKIAVIDGNSLMHRAYHAVPPTMNAPDGTPTNAVFGFLSMLFKFIDVASPDGIVCAFDQGKPQFRIEIMEQYKAQRPSMDDELRVQFPVIEGLLAAMNIPVVKVKGWEGDDILGTVSARNEVLGYETLLVSGDKDVCQLVSDTTRVVNTKRGISDVVIYDPAAVEDKYGVMPAQIPDFLGLAGDSSDNIPGIPGIGVKTAAKLLQKFNSMEGIYENLDKLKGKQLENVRDNKEQAFLSRKIATIVRDLDFALDVDAVEFPAFDVNEAVEAFRSIQFNAHLERLLSLVETDVSQVHTVLETPSYVTDKAADALVEEALASGERVGVAFVKPAQESLFFEGAIWAISSSVGTAVLEKEAGVKMFARLVREGSFAAFDVKEAFHQVYPVDSAVEARVHTAEILKADVFDLGLAAYVLNSSTSHDKLDTLVADYLQISLSDTERDFDTAAVAARASYLLVDPLVKALKADETFSVYCDIDTPLIGVLTVMERCGMPIDAKRLADLGASTQKELDELQKRIYEAADQTFNIDSPKQLSHILFDVLGLKPGKKTKSGYSTNARELTRLAHDHPLPELVLQYRELAKIKSTYIDALPRLAHTYGDGRIHTTFHETVTATGRLSSSDPNLQNIPVRTDFGRKIRDCFGALDEDSQFLSADYSQIELRLLAHLSGDEHLVTAFKSGEDFHAETAARIFGVSVDEVTLEMRSRAKAVNFGIVYGQQAFGLSQSLEIPFADAQEMIDRYFTAYPGVRTYLDDVVEQACERGFATTLFGRKRHIPELAAKNPTRRSFGERTAMNHPMQGSAADIIKLAMIEVQKRLIEENFEAKLMVQVHDELDFSVPQKEIEALSALVRDVMENVVALRVPLTVEVSVAPTWAQAH